MSLDHLCEEGPAYREDIKIPFHIIFYLLNNFDIFIQDTPQWTFLFFWTDNQDFLVDIQFALQDTQHVVLLVPYFTL